MGGIVGTLLGPGQLPFFQIHQTIPPLNLPRNQHTTSWHIVDFQGRTLLSGTCSNNQTTSIKRVVSESEEYDILQVTPLCYHIPQHTKNATNSFVWMQGQGCREIHSQTESCTHDGLVQYKIRGNNKAKGTILGCKITVKNGSSTISIPRHTDVLLMLGLAWSQCRTKLSKSVT